ncbi:hypothetical protein Tco_0645666 [Tanacetum coccineum]
MVLHLLLQELEVDILEVHPMVLSIFGKNAVVNVYGSKNSSTPPTFKHGLSAAEALIWIGSKPLKLLFPRIYALDNIKDATICMKLNEPSLDNNFRRSIRGGIEQSQFKELTDLLIPIVLNPCHDRWFWSLEGSGEFSVASIRRFIDDQRLLTVDSTTLWIKSVPIKVNILA